MQKSYKTFVNSSPLNHPSYPKYLHLLLETSLGIGVDRVIVDILETVGPEAEEGLRTYVVTW